MGLPHDPVLSPFDGTVFLTTHNLVLGYEPPATVVVVPGTWVPSVKEGELWAPDGIIPAAQANAFQNNAFQVGLAWLATLKQLEPWAPSSIQSESWTLGTKQSETWTPVAINSETWGTATKQPEIWTSAVSDRETWTLTIPVIEVWARNSGGARGMQSSAFQTSAFQADQSTEFWSSATKQFEAWTSH